MEEEQGMTQLALATYDDDLDALRDAVRVLGGTKTVGHALRPDLSPLNAAAWLKDCLNAERREKLALSQVITIMRMAHKAGYHGPAQYIAAEMGYQAQAVDPVDEQAALQRACISSVENLQRILERLERLGMGTAGLRVAK